MVAMAPRTPNPVCPACLSGDLISISMSVSGNPVSFTTCHFCEAKWWHREGQLVPLRSVIELASIR